MNEQRMPIDARMKSLLLKADEIAKKRNNPYVTPEHILLALSKSKTFKEVFSQIDGDLAGLRKDLITYLDKWVPSIKDVNTQPSHMTIVIMENAAELASYLNFEEIGLNHFIHSFLDTEDVFAVTILESKISNFNADDFKNAIYDAYGLEPLPSSEEIQDMFGQTIGDALAGMGIQILPVGVGGMGMEDMSGQRNTDWKSFVECLSDTVEKEDYVPLIGRKKELADTITVLLRKDKNNPIHIGEAGVGKTAIAMGLAKLINEDKVPDKLKGYKVYSCNMGSLVAGCMLRGDFEARVEALLKGIEKEKAILYIDEIHTICGNSSRAGSAADLLKPYLTNGSIKVAGATTTEEYRKTIERDSALDRRFMPIVIEEPSASETKEIMLGIKHKYEEFHKCRYGDEVIDSIITLTGKYMNDKKFPDKAIDIMDEIGASVASSRNDDDIIDVSINLAEEIIANKCKIPRDTVSTDEASKILNLSQNIKKKVIGQDEAVDKIRDSVVLSRSGLRDKNKPVANLLFVGPTGVGKTFIAQTLADSLGVPLIRKDMSEYEESHSVSKLFGSPAGYVGYNEGGMLINEIREKPHCVLLLDEIEKAHPDVYNVFLQIMDNASLTDSFGKMADFRNVVLIMTSNAGAADIKNSLGFGSGSSLNTSSVDSAVKRMFSPEFRNRLDAIIKFNHMSEEMARRIAENQMNELVAELKERNVSLEYCDEVIDIILGKGYSKEYGARNIKRIIDSDVKLPIANEMLFGRLKNGGICNLSIDDNEIVLK